jgi:hypothetical protein
MLTPSSTLWDPREGKSGAVTKPSISVTDNPASAIADRDTSSVRAPSDFEECLSIALWA